MIVGYDHREIGPVPLPGNPVRMPGMDGTISHLAPRVGERTDEVPGALPRLSAEQAAGLRAKGAVR